MDARVVSVDEVREFFVARPHPNVVAPLAHPENKRFIAVFDGSTVIAAATLERRPLGIDQLGGVLVDESVRGQGVGRVLMNAVFVEAKRRGARFIVCGVYRRDPDVSPYYQAVGFRTWIPFIPGTASRAPFGQLAKGLAKLFQVESGPDPIRVMARRV